MLCKKIRLFSYTQSSRRIKFPRSFIAKNTSPINIEYRFYHFLIIVLFYYDSIIVNITYITYESIYFVHSRLVWRQDWYSSTHPPFFCNLFKILILRSNFGQLNYTSECQCVFLKRKIYFFVYFFLNCFGFLNFQLP